jgi:hypothetical protein
VRENGIAHGSTDNAAHMLLGGVEGTGETTLLRALNIGVAVLLTRMPLVPPTHTVRYGATSSGLSPVDLLPGVLPAAASAASGAASVASSGGAPVAGAGGTSVLNNVEEPPLCRLTWRRR